jgi:tetrapyrrole methylase family protein/MazG family protein
MTDLKAKLYDNNLTPVERLCLLMEILRSPAGCNWDRAQDHRTLLPYLIEETYEVVEAIESGDPEALKEELGDLLCQIAFHAQLARERGQFDINDAANVIVEKLVRRHPHVFGERKDLAPQEVRDQWEKIKTTSGEKDSVLSGLPKSMPALTMAYRIGEKAGGVGFDWNTVEDVLQKVDEELAELRAELASDGSGRKARLTDEIGDLLFAVASAARKMGVEPESALKLALAKFTERFDRLEDEVRSKGSTFDDYSLEQLEVIWQRNKLKG